METRQGYIYIYHTSNTQRYMNKKHIHDYMWPQNLEMNSDSNIRNEIEAKYAYRGRDSRDAPKFQAHGKESYMHQ